MTLGYPLPQYLEHLDETEDDTQQMKKKYMHLLEIPEELKYRRDYRM